MKRVIIVHGWEGTPEQGWYPWMKKELEARGFEVAIPQLPDADNPRIDTWVSALSEAVGVPNKQTYFVGHSMGCQAIVRYIESLPEEQQVGGAVFVAGFFRPLTNLKDDELETDRLWAEAPVDFEKVRLRLPVSVALFSDDDPWVPLDNQNDFRDKLGSEIVVQHGKAHFHEGAGFRELPIVLEKLLEIANKSI